MLIDLDKEQMQITLASLRAVIRSMPEGEGSRKHGDRLEKVEGIMIEGLMRLELGNGVNEQAELKTSDKWWEQLSQNVVIRDPDGWDRRNFNDSFY